MIYLLLVILAISLIFVIFYLWPEFNEEIRYRLISLLIFRFIPLLTAIIIIYYFFGNNFIMIKTYIKLND
jgi:hypothetical protein